MLILNVENPEFVDDLCAHYRRSSFTAEHVGGGMIEVGVPDPVAVAREERREIVVHLRIWQIMNPEAMVEPL
jgi:hypothetical protein